MSEFQRSFAKSMLARLPPEVPHNIEEAQEEELDDVGSLPADSQDDDSSSASSASSTGTIRPSSTQNLFARAKGASISRTSLTAIPWTDFFSQELFINRTDGDVNIVHHGYITPPTNSGPLFVTHHGAGSSGLSFAVLFSELRKILPGAGIISLDARGHGNTTSVHPGKEEVPLDLTLDTLSDDVIFILKETRRKMGWPELPDMLLIGHSLGGAVMTEVAKKGQLGSSLLGYAVLDVVEGSAMDALQSMETYLSTRPTGFPSVASGIEWHTRSRTIRNTTSARASVPSLLREPPQPTSPSRQWVWRTDLAATKPFWEGWFVGLSKKFLEARGGKLLLLAGTDRLDKELIIGQMQGKYQLQVFPDAGHFIHEDQPAKTAQLIVDFYRRNDGRALVLPPKVGDLLKNKQGLQ